MSGKSCGIFIELFIDVFNVLNNLFFIEIIFLTVLCTQFGAVPGNQFTADEVEVFGNGHSVLKDFAYGPAVVPAEIVIVL